MPGVAAAAVALPAAAAAVVASRVAVAAAVVALHVAVVVPEAAASPGVVAVSLSRKVSCLLVLQVLLERALLGRASLGLQRLSLLLVLVFLMAVVWELEAAFLQAGGGPQAALQEEVPLPEQRREFAARRQ